MNRWAISSIIAPALAALVLASTVSAFSVNPPTTQQKTIAHLQTRGPLFAAEGGSPGEILVDSSASDEGTPSSEIADEPPKAAVKCPDCDLCDGSGRILGGIGTVLDWWPIKAYRPCPNFIERGGRYVRSGQGLDEIAFGRDSTFQSDK